LKVIESKQFKDELRAIAFYIKKDKPTASIAFVVNLKKLLKGLVDFPINIDNLSILKIKILEI
jgi:plasmid stabilization system protein ParE